MDVLQHLIEEHRKVEGMLKQLEQSKPGPQREQLVGELVESLSTHMAVEEKFVYPITESVVGAEEAEGAENEHGLTRDGLTALRKLVDKPGFAAAVEMVTAGIKHHVEEEESDLFPQLRRKAARQIAELGDPEELEAAAKKGRGRGRDGATREELYRKAQKAGIEGRSSMTKQQLARALQRV